MIDTMKIREAQTRIEPFIRTTPLIQAREFSDCELLLKLENFQVTGSFKARGGINKLCTLGETGRARGIITASSGNHGAAVAFGSDAMSCEATVFVPEGADPSKIATIKGFGANVQIHGSDCSITEGHARTTAKEANKTYISPYNDLDVITGQGTLGAEITDQTGPIDAIFVSLGGGGLIAGIGSFFKTLGSTTEIVACSPERSPAMHACLEAGSIIDVPCYPTLSDATAGGVEAGSITYELCEQVVDTSILVTEDEIKAASRYLIETHHMLVEGAAGVALAAFLKTRDKYLGKKVVVLICGANIGIDKLRRILA